MQIKQITKSLLHLFFPETCLGCGSDAITEYQPLCIQCNHRLPVTDFWKIPGNATEKILSGRIPFTDAASHYFFTQQSLIQQLLHHLKYKGRQDIGEFLGRKMGEALLESGRFKNIDALVPMPLHKQKLKKRRYNQAAVLCNGIASVTQLPVLENIIVRIAAAGSQTTRNRLERWENIAGSFQVQDATAASGKHLLLVDDVITTGATIEACSAALLKAPGTRLSVCTLACAMK